MNALRAAQTRRLDMAWAFYGEVGMMTPTNSTLFRVACDTARPTLTDLADYSGISKSLIDKIRWNQRQPSVFAMLAMAKGLRKQSDALYILSRQLQRAVDD